MLRRESSFVGHLTICRLAIALVVSLVVFAPEANGQVANPRFSWDEHSLAFDRCESGRCGIVIVSLIDKHAVALDVTDGYEWVNPEFDPKSERIVFVRVKRGRRGIVDSQIATSSRAGAEMKVLTASNTIKQHPSFSFDGSKIIFAAKERSPDAGKPVFADAYQYSLTSRREQRLTDLRVVSISAPFFLPNGEEITFSTRGSALPRSKKPAPVVGLDARFPNKTLFVLPAYDDQELVPLRTGTLTASNPMPIEDGSIAFFARVNDDGHTSGGFIYDVFFATGTQVTRYTKFRSYARGYGISRTGRYVAFVTSKDGSFKNAKIVLWNSRDGTSQELKYEVSEEISVKN